jgi:hypothetical protein
MCCCETFERHTRIPDTETGRSAHWLERTSRDVRLLCALHSAKPLARCHLQLSHPEGIRSPPGISFLNLKSVETWSRGPPIYVNRQGRDSLVQLRYALRREQNFFVAPGNPHSVLAVSAAQRKINL